MYKLLENNQVLYSEDGKTFTSYCNLYFIDSLNNEYEFCLGECGCEWCNGKYHLSKEVLGEKVMSMVQEDTYNPDELIEISEKQENNENDIIISTLADTTINLLSKLTDVEGRLSVLEGGV